jgi:hypothetical protein
MDLEPGRQRAGPGRRYRNGRAESVRTSRPRIERAARTPA